MNKPTERKPHKACREGILCLCDCGLAINQMCSEPQKKTGEKRSLLAGQKCSDYVEPKRC